MCPWLFISKFYSGLLLNASLYDNAIVILCLGTDVINVGLLPQHVGTESTKSFSNLSVHILPYTACSWIAEKATTLDHPSVFSPVT